MLLTDFKYCVRVGVSVGVHAGRISSLIKLTDFKCGVSGSVRVHAGSLIKQSWFKVWC